MFERVIVASGTSNRQTKALAASVRDSVRSRDFPILSTEGEDNGEWIIVDCGAAVVHIMQPAIREYYHLEEIWGGKAVKMKLGEINTKLVKASEPEPAALHKARSAAPADGAPAKTPRAPGSRAAARAVKRDNAKEVAEKKSTNRTAAYQRVAAKTAPRRAAPAAAGAGAARTPAAKAPAKKSTTQTIVVKPPAKKTVAAKAPAKKTAPARKSAPAKKATRKA
jgi:ribosome-associated protein